ncbi:tetratricopeptide repeat protein [Lutibacter citreus]|uniref:tetratricopeptide repeat protein n=1 Tax=Lutibacter citreus TaxID=2138210 RepID=UPI000DBE0DBA|nr:hypothetical protein [Lutibacter citreus]
MKLNQFLKECNNKEVFKKLSIYIVSSWVLIQVMAVTWEPLGVPKKSVTVLLIILLIGFPVNVYLVWKYHLAPLEVKKIKLDENGNLIETKKNKSSFKKMYFSVLTIISFISIFVSTLIINNNFKSHIKINTVNVSDKIAVLKFGNNTGDKKYDIVSKMAADWIIHGISENKLGQVVSPKIIENYAKLITTAVGNSSEVDEKLIKDYFNPAKVISGNFYLKDDSLLFQGSIKDGQLNNTLISFKLVDCKSNEPIDCMEKLKQLILGYLITEDNKQLNLQEVPPQFEAYQLVLDAKANFSNDDRYLNYLNKAIEIDSNYFEPKLLKIGHFYNLGQFKKADSLRKEIPISSNRNERQKNLMNLYESMLQGNNKKTYNFITKEYNIAPFDLESNSSTMTIALQYVNKPEDINKIYNEISMEDLDIENSKVCLYRIYIKSLADIELQKLKEVIKYLEIYTRDFDDFNLKRTLATAYVRDGEDMKLQNFISKIKLTSSINEYEAICLFVGKEYLLLDNKKMANNYLNTIIKIHNGKENSKNLAAAYYYLNDYKNAEKVIENLLNKGEVENEFQIKLAVSYFYNGKKEASKKILDKLIQLERNYNLGELDYHLAQYYSAIGNGKTSLEYLLKSVAKGYSYTPDTYQNDVHFLKYKNSIEISKIMKFWH